VNFEPPAPRSENLTLFTGLAGGVGDALINLTLATVNDTSAMLAEFLGNRTVEGMFWSV